MIYRIPLAQTKEMLICQLSSLFLLEENEVADIDHSFDESINACENAFAHVKNKYYSRDGEAYFDSLHGCQYAMFLYQLSRQNYLGGGAATLSDKLYALLKMMSSADLFYQVELPEIFTFDHPLGAVMGRAEYSDYFNFSQGCTIGNNKGIYPRFGESVFMMSNSKVIGDCRIGDYVIISANAYVKDTNIPSGSIVFGQNPNLIIKEDKLNYVQSYAESVFKYE